MSTVIGVLMGAIAAYYGGLGRRGIDAHNGILPDRTWLCVGSGTDRHFHAIVGDVVSAIGFVGWPAMAR
jgi:hypothetical protein